MLNSGLVRHPSTYPFEIKLMPCGATLIKCFAVLCLYNDQVQAFAKRLDTCSFSISQFKTVKNLGDIKKSIIWSKTERKQVLGHSCWHLFLISSV